jgi:hypothetical protein
MKKIIFVIVFGLMSNGIIHQICFAEEETTDSIDIIKTLTDTFSREMPIDNFCLDSTERKKTEKAPLLNLSLVQTLGVSSKQAIDLICSNSKAHTIKSVTPANTDGEQGFDKFIFLLRQKEGCEYKAIFYKDKDGDTSLDIDENTKCPQQKKVTEAQEYYGVEWDGSEIDQLNSYGYNPKTVSKHMYEANDSCGKSIKSISKDKQNICIKYKCGFTTWSYVIDTYREAGKPQSSGWCFWEN